MYVPSWYLTHPFIVTLVPLSLGALLLVGLVYRAMRRKEPSTYHKFLAIHLHNASARSALED